ncbi:MAG: hypothetical protein RMN53_13405, partial [Anaerolineae bacterium]|nr:hypothetical protein [Anaerolineae bacterium]
MLPDPSSPPPAQPKADRSRAPWLLVGLLAALALFGLCATAALTAAAVWLRGNAQVSTPADRAVDTAVTAEPPAPAPTPAVAAAVNRI